ncbi:MAG: alanine racemase [Oscillospiraceae bacterium]|nr:alanine racemase [Oscillospiraceae bacterium]
MSFDNTYVQIDLDAIRENLLEVHRKTGTKVMAVIKADAYGHGAVQVARHIQEDCAFFGVSSLTEAMELRQAGLDKPILILGHTPVDGYSRAVAMDVRIAIFKLEDALALSRVAQIHHKTAHIHLAVDTGMSRIGFEATPESADLCRQIAELPNLEVEGLFSHFATADCADLTRAKAQAARFEAFTGMLRERGVSVSIRHLNNSAGLMNFDGQYDLVRSGIVTYGLYPSEEVDPALLPLRPALSWYSRISHIKTLPAGREISYGGTYVTAAPTKVATITVGYADGYSRSLSGRFYVLIRGKRAPILGRVCMDQMMVDVTHIPDVTCDDPVTLVGRDGDEVITVEQIAQVAGSFNYEFICSISRRVPRVYYRDGAKVRVVHYLLDNF